MPLATYPNQRAGNIKQERVQFQSELIAKFPHEYEDKEEDSTSDDTYLCMPANPLGLFLTIPIGPFSITYYLYLLYTRLLKLYDWFFTKELVDFYRGYKHRFVKQSRKWIMSWQLINFTVSAIKDLKPKDFLAQKLDNFVTSRIRLRHRIFDFLSNISYVGIGLDLRGRLWFHNKTTRQNKTGDVISMLWNKDDLRMGFIEYWIHKLLNQPLRPGGALWERFEMFRIFYNKSYEPKELFQRMGVFVNNLQVIASLNRRETGTAIYGLSQYSDRTVEEFAQIFGAYNSTADDTNEYINEEISPISGYVPDYFDWRYIFRVVTAPKDYRSCPAAWAYTVVENIETLHAIRTGQQKNFSDQQIIDCDRKSMGCRGGSVINAYQYVYRAGLTEENNYPYMGYQEKCHYNPSMADVEIQKGFKYIMPDEEKMRNYIYSYGPVIARINIGPLQFYKKGIIRCYHEICDPRVQNYVVNLYGYGLLTKLKGKKIHPVPYWIGKNFWGSWWGEEVSKNLSYILVQVQARLPKIS
nr:PREDICTED: cathepsin W-like [Bemisia tabaci]